MVNLGMHVFGVRYAVSILVTDLNLNKYIEDLFVGVGHSGLCSFSQRRKVQSWRVARQRQTAESTQGF